MNRENKRKTFEKGYYKTHACNDTFTCKVCGRVCTPQNAGSDHRNHCPNCLSSLHVDEEPGDRASDCGGIMEPVAVWVRKGGEWAIIHRCKRCGKLSSNRVAADDKEVFSSKQKLYEFEALCVGTMLFRCSKSMILNAGKIDYVLPSLSGRFEAALDNGEKVIISRQYVSTLKRLLGR